ncbi:MAG: alpha/beta hydrolase [Proteobacteria bacterium]|nr:alpha/beta hydrolase [Pseudomonadota bacterium]
MPPLIRFTMGLLPAIACAAHAQSPDPTLDLYAQPGNRIAISPNRHLNLRCTGQGSPTVILESGNNADSMAWFKVQPAIATFTRVCSYDRAGTGFSDGGPLPRNVDSNADDLAALIRAARIATPVVLVGHSYGTNIVRRFADAHANEVAALVLIDPPPQGVGAFSPEFEKADAAQRQQMLGALRHCEQGAETGKLEPPASDYKDCLRGPNSAFSAALNTAMLANKIKPAFWQTMISITQTNADLYRQPVPSAETHGAIPLLILQPDTPFEDVPPQFRKAMEQARQKTHRAIAATSTRGKIIAVAQSSHDVQIDQPHAVIAAVRTVVHPH